MSNYDYNFTIHTGDELWAGTDSNIFVQLIGERGITNEMRLNGYIKGNAFERNKTDTCSVPFNKNVGDVYRIRLRSDHRHGGADWLLDYIYVQGEDECSKTEFQIAEWIDDKRTHVYDTTGGYPATLEFSDVEYVEELGKRYYLTNPTDNPSTQSIEVIEAFNVEFDFDISKIVSASTKAGVTAAYGDIEAALELFVEARIEERTGHTWGKGKTHTLTVDYTLDPHTEVVLVSVWSTRSTPIKVTLGDTVISDGLEKDEREFSGLRNAETGQWIYRVGEDALSGRVLEAT